MTWQQHLKKMLVPRPVAGGPSLRAVAGLYHYQRARPADGYVRFHLRVDPDGSALLVAGAAEMLRLTPVGTYVAQELLAGPSVEQAVKKLAAIRQLSPRLVAEVIERLDKLGQPGSGRFPVINLTDPAIDGPSTALVAPIQADVVIGEPATTRQVLDRLWQAGIPHARFRVTNSADQQQQFLAAVRHAENLGMIAGIAAPAAQLSTGDWLRRLADVGLDYAVIPWGVTGELHEKLFGQEDAARLEEAISLVQRCEMCPVVEVPLIPQTADALPERLKWLNSKRVSNVEVFALAAVDQPASSDTSHIAPPTSPILFFARQLRQVAAEIEQLASRGPATIVWLPPVEVQPGASIDDAVRRGPRCGGDLSIRVEADGTVIPPRGPHEAAGNLLSQSWDEIWRQPALVRYRRRVESATRCDACPGLNICAADCPADPQGWARG
ncbi:MAG: SPASM domain-containing protein [Planctomycetia bacterium]|nr:SPASM domain-containing protein [Planctomycetia bacterium]